MKSKQQYKYIGVDAHSSTCTFVVMDKEGVILDEVTIATNGRLLVEYIEKISGPKKLAFEECELTQWVFSLFNGRVEELIVCNPVKNREYKRSKTDRLDARMLADLLRGNYLKPVYHNGSEREQYRNLISGYLDEVQELVRMKCRYKSIYRKTGKNIKGEKIYKEKEYLKQIDRTYLDYVAEQFMEIIKFLEEKKETYRKKIIKENRKFEEIKYLKSIPGISDIRAAIIVSEVIDPARFKNRNKYYGYCALVRLKKSSAGKDKGSEKIWGNRKLKCVYKMAVQDIIKGQSGLRKYYEEQIKKGLTESHARTALARKVASISISLWKNRKKYNDKEFIENHLKEND